MGKGHWAVAVRIASTGKGMFVDGANEVQEEIARKAFGRAIRASELGLPVDGEMVNAIRLLKWDHEVVNVGGGDVIVDAEGSWRIAQQHEVGAIERWNELANDLNREGELRLAIAPYHDETIASGVPCIPGAWGGDGCAMHSGFPRDVNGLCVEGHRAVKRLGLIVVPKRLQELAGVPATMTPEELIVIKARLVQELVRRDKSDNLTDEQLTEAVTTLDAQQAQHERKVFVAFPDAPK